MHIILGSPDWVDVLKCTSTAPNLEIGPESGAVSRIDNSASSRIKGSWAERSAPMGNYDVLFETCDHPL